MSQDVRPFTPLLHCPQCDGTIDQRAVRSEPMRRSYNPLPRRRTECWCDFCKVGFRACSELRGSEWVLIHSVTVLRDDDAKDIRQYADQQTGVIQRKSA